MTTPLQCDLDERKAVLRGKNVQGIPWNGIDYVQPDPQCAKSVQVYFLCRPPHRVGPESFLLTDLARNEEIPVDVILEPAAVRLRARLDRLSQGTPVPALPAGTYRLTLVGLSGIDPRYRSADFNIFAAARVGEAVRADVSDIDPKPRPKPGLPQRRSPEINYLARDFASIRQVLLDRLSLQMPEWRERHAPDLGIMLVELFAYLGDYLSYHQDAVATEAYLGTSRMRVSVRRHARLVDYTLHEGCNARGWVQLTVAADVLLDPRDVSFRTQLAAVSLRDRAVIREDELSDEDRSQSQAYSIVEYAADPARIACDDIKDWNGLAAWLVEGIHPLAARLQTLAPPDLATRVVAWAIEPQDAFPQELANDVCHFLRTALSQHCFWTWQALPSRSECESARQPAGRGCLTSRNWHVLQEAAPQFFGKRPGADGLIPLYRDLSEMEFYTWDRSDCHLPKGATSATLRDTLTSDPDEAYSARRARSHVSMQRHLADRRLRHLSPGDVLILEEVLGPKTGIREDADPSHRQAVRLTRVSFVFDPVHDVPLVEIEWGAEDALRFPLCISSTGESERCPTFKNVSVARGNVLLVDHRLAFPRQSLGSVPQPASARPCCNRDLCVCEQTPMPVVRERFEPAISESDLTFAEPLNRTLSAWKAVLDRNVHDAIPGITLWGLPEAPGEATVDADGRVIPRPILGLDAFSDSNRFVDSLLTMSEGAFQRLQQEVDSATARSLFEVRRGLLAEPPEFPAPDLVAQLMANSRNAFRWTARADLLQSRANDRHFVVEMDNERRPRLRFGDGTRGRKPEPGETFWADFDIGSGPAGNTGAESIVHLMTRRGGLSAVERVRNPMAAIGGEPPETLESAKFSAPTAFRKLKRAITDDDYAKLAMDDFRHEVQAARAVVERYGNRRRVAVTIDPLAIVRRPDILRDRVEEKLRLYRRIGHELIVRLPTYVALDIAMTVCVDDGFLRAHVQQELLDVLGNRTLPDGRIGFFHSDRFSFGDPIYLSRLVRAARDVPGVENVVVTRLRRYGRASQGEIDAGVLPIGPFEIPRLDNDGRRPECGRLCLEMRGRR